MSQGVQVDGIYSSWLKKALARAGDELLLADALKVAPADLRRWINGEEAPPLAVFADAVAIGTPPAGVQGEPLEKRSYEVTTIQLRKYRQEAGKRT
jgi:hypothetical protein